MQGDACFVAVVSIFISKKLPCVYDALTYYVYMTAGMTKFLRIYYGKVRDCLKEKGLWEQSSMDEVNPG